MRATAIPTLVLLALAAPAAADDDERLDGKWVVESVNKDGKADDAWKGAVRQHTGNRYTMTQKGGKSVSGTMKVDVVKKTMDLMPAEGTYKGKTLKGLYAFGKETDTLTICFAEPGKDRPKELATGEGITVAVYRRKK